VSGLIPEPPTPMKKYILLFVILPLSPVILFGQYQTIYDLHKHIHEDPIIMLEIAQGHQALNNYDSAFFYLEKAEKVLEDKLTIRQLRGVLAREAKKYDMAIGIFYGLVQEDSQGRYVYMEEVARTYYEKEAFSNAIQTYRILIQDNPEEKKRYLYEAGMCCYEMKKIEDALRYFRRAAHAGHEHASDLVNKFETEYPQHARSN